LDRPDPRFTRICGLAIFSFASGFAPIPRPDWILPARRLPKLTDFELLLVVYVLSDIESPPLDKIFKDFSDWLNKLIEPASRLKASILKGTNIRVRDMFPASPGGA